MRKDGALLRGARSAKAFAGGHIEGALNLSLPDSTDDALRNTIRPDRSWPIYMYYNNYCTDNRAPRPTMCTRRWR